MGRMSAFNLASWVAAHRDELVPPVGNKLLYDGEFKIMLVAGPNARNDYHVEEGEEWFYQLEGRLVLRVVDKAGSRSGADGGGANGLRSDGSCIEAFYDVVLGPGDTFCLPPRVPHSPQREPGSLGIVVERERRNGELDALQWYCQEPTCRQLLFRKEFVCRDLGSDLLPIIREYYADVSRRTCSKCGFVEVPVE